MGILLMRRCTVKKHTVIRCPAKLAEAMGGLCQRHRVSRSRFINLAVFNLIVHNSAKGLLPPYPGYELPPPPPEPRRYYL